MSMETHVRKYGSNAPAAPEATRSCSTYVPRCDIFERDKELVLLADMPGVNEKSVDVELENAVLTLTGHIQEEEFPGYELKVQEYPPGNFRRSFTLSDEFDVNRIEASMRNGVLQVILPKAEAARPRKIALKYN
ncbi:MAG: Hsp20/alpha crystallin family protein [Planctomycetes bacterium]|nr:Hsp20/alpha crystallin family protein [Planctomycetota bacterium]